MLYYKYMEQKVRHANALQYIKYVDKYDGMAYVMKIF